MKHLQKISRLGLSVTFAGLLLILLTVSLWAAAAYAPSRETAVTTTFPLTRITTGASDRDSVAPTVNSDGSKIAFYSDADLLGQGIPANQGEIWLYDTATMTVTRVTTGASDRSSFSPTISSDGSKIVFYSDADLLGQGIPDNQDEIWLYDTATMTVTRVTTGTIGRYSQYPTINSDGSKIAFYSDADLLGQGILAGQNEIWLYDTATMTVTRVTTGVVGRDSVRPTINSDGSKIAFGSNSDFLGQGIVVFQFEIWLYDTATMTVTRVTTGASGRGSQSPSINSDGSKIVFYSDADLLGQGIPANQNEIWLYDTATMTVTRVTTGASDRDSLFPVINSDGRKIAFYGDADFLGQGIPAGQDEIWLYDTATMTVTRITSGASDRDNRFPNINGDGRKIAFESDADFLGQGIPMNQGEIWLYYDTTYVYLPVILKN